MVLEGATSDDAFPPDQLPQSSADPYETTTASRGDPSKLFLGNDANARPVVVDLDALPQPITLFTSKRLSQSIGSAIERSCRLAENVLKRPITQDEAEALAQIYASSIQTASYGSIVGFCVGMVFALRGRKDFRFPFWRPFREGSGLSPDKFGPLTGDIARRAWNISGMTAYLTGGVIAGQALAGSYAMSASLRARAREPRLREFNARLSEAMKQGQLKKIYDDTMKDPRPADREPGPRGSETWEQAQQRRRVQDMSKKYEETSRSRPVTSSQQSIIDDASPTGGAMQADFLSDAQVQSQATHSRSMTHDSVDEGSSSSPSPPIKSSGSVWERIRQGSVGANQSSSRTPAPSRAASIQQQSNLSSAEQRRRAQEEFDAQLERERSGSS